MKMHVAVELSHADRRTEVRRTLMTKPIVAFRNFAYELKNCKLYLVTCSKLQTF